MTNREFFNNMTDRELAEYTYKNFLWFCGDCKLSYICDKYERNRGECVATIEKYLSLEH